MPDVWAGSSDPALWAGGPGLVSIMGFFPAEELRDVRRFYENAAAPATPLERLAGLAAALGIGGVLVKDESDRFGLPAFKIVGARYAIARVLDSQPGVQVLAAATAGNHGRAVARVARERGVRARIYVPAGTDPARVAALESEGAGVVVTSVDYDHTVRLMAREANAHGWTIVSDTAWPGYEQIPRWIMAGYTWIFEEASSQWEAPPDAMIVQAGVGSLAGAAAGWLEARPPHARPKLIIAEPEGSNCVGASLEAGARVTLPGCAPTAMVGLRCAEVSSIAWPVIQRVATAAVGISESDVARAVRMLAAPAAGDPRIAAGASGACGVAALAKLVRFRSLARLRDELPVRPSTRIMAIVTEGAT
jgi:diaminopropionate ammonia-lyase